MTILYKYSLELFLGSMRDINKNASIFSVRTAKKDLSLGCMLLLLNLFPFISDPPTSVTSEDNDDDVVIKALGLPHPFCRSSMIEAGPFMVQAGGGFGVVMRV